MKWKKNLLLMFCLLGGVIVGSLIADFAMGVSFLRWLSYGETVGIPVSTPVTLDLGVIRVAFALQMGINIAQIITIVLSLFLYKSLSKKL